MLNCGSSNSRTQLLQNIYMIGIICTNFLRFSISLSTNFPNLQVLSYFLNFYVSLHCFEIKDMVLYFSTLSTSKINSSSSKLTVLFTSLILSLILPISSSVKAVCFYFSSCFILDLFSCK